MNEGKRDSFESPLDEVLTDIPQEDPPADLKDRCLQAVRNGGAAEAAPSRSAIWPVLWKGAAGLAAAFIVMVALITVMPQDRGEERVSGLPSETPHVPASLQPETPALEEAESLAEPIDATVAVENRKALVGALAPLPEDSTRDQVLPEGSVRTQVVDAGDAGGGLEWTGSTSSPQQADRARSYRRGDSVAVSGDARTVVTRSLRVAMDEEAEAGANYDDYDAGPSGAPSRPWRDESGERKKETRKDMKLEADDVEDTHQRATSIITRAKGYVDTEELRLNERGESEAVIWARVPVGAIDGVVAQLRELGKVVSLYGQSEDRTNEYYGQGQSIRELAEKEVALVEKYEKETNRSRKQQLYRQITAIRDEIKRRKAPLKQLSDEVHFAFLDLTIIQAAGPRQFLHDLSDSVPTAAAWLAVSAVFWIPLLIVIIAIWRRVSARIERE